MKKKKLNYNGKFKIPEKEIEKGMMMWARRFKLTDESKKMRYIKARAGESFVAVFDVRLTKQQEKYWETFEWLNGDNRASGRTTLLALYFIQQAINNINKEIEISDHHTGYEAKRRLIDRIAEIVSGSEYIKKLRLHLRVNMQNLKICLYQ